MNISVNHPPMKSNRQVCYVVKLADCIRITAKAYKLKAYDGSEDLFRRNSNFFLKKVLKNFGW